MNNFISFFTRPVTAFFSVLLVLGVSSCSNEPQRLLFSNHPTEFKRPEKEVAAVNLPETAPVTASTAAAPAVILSPAAYAQEKATTEITRNEAVKKALKHSSAHASKLSLREKMVTLKTVKKEIKAAKKEVKNLKKDNQKVAAGPVSNDVAIKIIILGLIVALLGLIVSPLGGVGGLIVIVGLVLLLLNYL